MEGFLTRETAFRHVLDLAERAARSNASVLITGESGTGKSRLARWVHDRSDRRERPFVEVSCANLPGELAESTLFGHERGAFTDAREERPGRFELAHGGTLYIDEVQELEPAVQAKVLRAIEDRRFERLGGHRTVEVDIRIVASTLEDPDRLVAEERLREDLYYRLNVVRIAVPPLRERRADVLLLAAAFLQEAASRHHLPLRRLTAEAAIRLESYAWPGNVRELRHAMESAAVLCQGDEIALADLPRDFSMSSPAMVRSAAAEGLTLCELERAYIEEVLRRTRGNKTAAARILGIHRKTLYEKLRNVRGRGSGT